MDPVVLNTSYSLQQAYWVFECLKKQDVVEQKIRNFATVREY